MLIIRYANAIVAVLLAWTLTACSGHNSNDRDTQGAVELQLPERIRQIDAVDPAQLSVAVIVNGQTYSGVRQPNGSYITRVPVPANEESALRIIWTEDFEQVPLSLAEQNLTVPVGSVDETIVVEDNYTTTGPGFDNDGDGFSNLAERTERTDPLSADDRPDRASLQLSITLPQSVTQLGDQVSVFATVNSAQVALVTQSSGLLSGTVGALVSGNSANAAVQINASGVTLAAARVAVVLQPGDGNRLTIEQSDFDTSADADADGLSNLIELLRGTDPRSAIDYRVIQTDSAPLVDGTFFDGIWRERFNALDSPSVNRLISADSGEEQITGDGLNSAWAAVTDNETLYLAIRIIDDVIIADSGGEWWKDDTVEIFIDGDNSKQTGTFDGINDYHIAFRVEDQQVIRGGLSLALPPSLFFELSATSFAADIARGLFPEDANEDGERDTGFNLEMALSLSELGINIGAPFGINVHYNDDDNSGDRDAKYAWTGQFGQDIDYLEPSALGTAIIGN